MLALPSVASSFIFPWHVQEVNSKQRASKAFFWETVEFIFVKNFSRYILTFVAFFELRIKLRIKENEDQKVLGLLFLLKFCWRN